MTLYVSALWMSHEVSGATSLCFSDINENWPFRFFLTFGEQSTCAMMDHVSDRSINHLPIHHLNGFFCNIQITIT